MRNIEDKTCKNERHIENRLKEREKGRNWRLRNRDRQAETDMKGDGDIVTNKSTYKLSVITPIVSIPPSQAIFLIKLSNVST